MARGHAETADQSVRHRRSLAALLVAARVREKNTPDALGHAVSAIFAVLERTASSGTEEMRIVESAELLAQPKRRFDPIAIRSP